MQTFSEEEQNVVRFCTRVQAFQNLPIHFLDSLERAIAVSDDVLVPQMKVGGEPNVEHSSFLQQGTGNKYSMPGGDMSKANRIDPTGLTLLRPATNVHGQFSKPLNSLV